MAYVAQVAIPPLKVEVEKKLLMLNFAIASIKKTNIPGKALLLNTERNNLLLIDNHLLNVNENNKIEIPYSNVISIVQTDSNIFLFARDKIIVYSSKPKTCHIIDTFKGIRVAVPNYSEELIVILTSEELIMVNYDLELVNSCMLGGTEQQALVNVGWGSTKTQFNGKKVEESNETSQEDNIINDRSPLISWRGDDEYFCLLLQLTTGKSQLYVYTQDLVLCNKSTEFTATGGLSWGRWITVGSFDKMMLYETNALLRSSFAITNPDLKSIVNHVKWNSNFTILAILLNGELQIWSTNNFKWYHKLTIPLVSQFQWSASNPYEIFSTDKDYFKSTVLTPTIIENLGLVVVIDNPRLLITPFQKVNIPPPLAHFTYISESIRHVALSVQYIAILGNEGKIELLDAVSYSKIATFQYVFFNESVEVDSKMISVNEKVLVVVGERISMFQIDLKKKESFIDFQFEIVGLKCINNQFYVQNVQGFLFLINHAQSNLELVHKFSNVYL
jgi:hypothetical protein